MAFGSRCLVVSGGALTAVIQAALKWWEWFFTDQHGKGCCLPWWRVHAGLHKPQREAVACRCSPSNSSRWRFLFFNIKNSSDVYIALNMSTFHSVDQFLLNISTTKDILLTPWHMNCISYSDTQCVWFNSNGKTVLFSLEFKSHWMWQQTFNWQHLKKILKIFNVPLMSSSVLRMNFHSGSCAGGVFLRKYTLPHLVKAGSVSLTFP